MDIGTTINRVKAQYKQYLKNKHPEWADSTVSTHVSDAFYIWQNTLAVSFWKVFDDDESMQNAYEAIYDYLLNEKRSDRAEPRAKAYYADLRMFRAFLDEVYGGARGCVGIEYDCEDTIYACMKQAYDGKLTAEQAVELLCEKVPCCTADMHKKMIAVFSSMMTGRLDTNRANIPVTMCFLEQIGKDYGIEQMTTALRVVWDGIHYDYERQGLKYPSLRRFCRKLAAEYRIDLDFDDTMFDDIIMQKYQVDNMLADRAGVRYWLYAPNNEWEQMYSDGIISISRDYLGDPARFGSKAEIQTALVECAAERNATTYKNVALEVWQFVNEMKKGDIVIAKKGTKAIIGRGIVSSDFIYDEMRPEGYRAYRMIEWTHKGEWEHPGTAITKRLTDITPYTDYLKEVLAKLPPNEDDPEDIAPQAEPPEPYTKEDFLREVYMDEATYQMLHDLVLDRKNIILQGSPGVGKTFAAKRLAYAIMKKKDSSRVKMVQFHQSYSYEDFIMGYRPVENGFKLETGAFYEFCKEAEKDDETVPYFFIIDEINRGNLSKIFGELFMLIERDKRGIGLRLLYRDEQFSVPPNVHIIGMMNTADRSLAMMDYALRRRFSFYDMRPAFDSDGFKAYQQAANNDRFNKLIAGIKDLNKHIADDDALGEGFCIGHSYFITNKPVTDEWIRTVIEYDMIPLLKEYWFDEPDKVKHWSAELRGVLA